MGARVTRMFRNFNLENRAHKEISRQKPVPAPRHTVRDPPPAGAGSSGDADALNQKNESLLGLLRSVYVDSTDPAAAEVSNKVMEDETRRPLKFHVPSNTPGLAEVTDVPKGKLSIAEALKALNSHQREPLTWTPEKIAQDYSLDLKDTKAFLEYFILFRVYVQPTKTENTKQIKAS
ncbi:NADH dehydrogenase [ubiquinone] 1 alpha subcomplex assembly factor 4 [Antennarius striatus]|uniref:NADH dehydrogenase [ubiquinone] 1 alpha subcomplex assembly factor 4 n=1 Tax=Antennarius striatus TaxID=241820 RepID=UPI0035AD9758